MRKFFLGAIVITLALSGGTSYLCAQPTEDTTEAAVQSLGSKTRAEITRAGKIRTVRSVFKRKAIKRCDVTNWRTLPKNMVVRKRLSTL